MAYLEETARKEVLWQCISTRSLEHCPGFGALLVCLLSYLKVHRHNKIAFLANNSRYYDIFIILLWLLESFKSIIIAQEYLIRHMFCHIVCQQSIVFGVYVSIKDITDISRTCVGHKQGMWYGDRNTNILLIYYLHCNLPIHPFAAFCK